jgi:hypothetical protein
MFTAQCPVGDIIPAHAHHDTHETFYIVEGKVRVYVQLPDGEKTSRLLSEGGFGFVPAGAVHAYRVEAPARILGTATGGFERFFQSFGTPTDTMDTESPPFIPDFHGCRPPRRPTTCGSCQTSPGPTRNPGDVGPAAAAPRARGATSARYRAR